MHRARFVQEGCHPHLPPSRGALEGGCPALEGAGFSQPCPVQRGLDLEPVLSTPEVRPQQVVAHREVVDLHRLLPAGVHRQQPSVQVQHLDTVGALLHDAVEHRRIDRRSRLEEGFGQGFWGSGHLRYLQEKGWEGLARRGKRNRPRNESRESRRLFSCSHFNVN